jgi:hypothetical protein
LKHLWGVITTWCSQVRRSRRLIEEGNQKQYPLKLSNAEIERLDAVGFQWELTSAAFDKRIEELGVFKAKFGHCNVTTSRSASNKPYMSLGHWCSQVRRSRRLIEEGNQKQYPLKLSKAEIERLDAVGFQWESNYATFDDRIEELRAFKAKFGHCNVTLSTSATNQPYLSLGRWCSQVLHCRRLIEEGMPVTHKLSNAQIERLDALGFQWGVTSLSFDERIEELRAFKANVGHCNVTPSRSASNKPYLTSEKWCNYVRRSRTLCKAQIASLDADGFQW